MNSRDSSVNIVKRDSFRVHHYFSFSQDFVDNSHFGFERCMCCAIKVKNNSPGKYIAYSQASYYLSLIRTGI